MNPVKGNLNNLGTRALREYIANRARLLAVVGLHVNSFKPFTGTKTSVVFLQKWGGDAGERLEDYPVFMAVKHGLQPPYLDGGNVGIVSQRQFTGSGLDLDSLENFTNDDFCKENPDFLIRRDDVLTYCVSAGEYLGRTYLFGSDRPCVAASFVTILRTTKLVPGYLALFLNSPFGLIQSNGFKRGTSPFYLYPRDLKNVLVYVPRNKSGEIDIAWQEKLAAKVEAFTRAHKQAQAKLAEAKKLVEDALENI